MIKNHICRIHKLEGNKLEGYSVGDLFCARCSGKHTGGTTAAWAATGDQAHSKDFV